MKSFSIKTKLIALSIFLLSISMILGAVSYWNLNRVIKDYTVITDVSFPNTTNILETYLNFRLSRIQVLYIVSPVTTKEEKEKAVETLEKNFKIDADLNEKYLAIDFMPGEEELYTSFRKNIDAGNGFFKKVVELHKLGKSDDPEIFGTMNDIVFKDIAQIGAHTIVNLDKLKDFHHNISVNAIAEAKSDGTMAITVIISLIAALGSVGMISAFFFSNSLTKSLKDISEALDESSAQVSAAAGQIASSSEELSQAASEQASSLEETSSSVEEMSSMVNINSENAKKASETSSTSKSQAERGRAVVEEMVQSMAHINESNNNIMTQINSSNEQMGEIVKVIQEIETKTKVINDIVFQTKLLSFNASVEAARAGEQGKGFAVVAEEVGNLAQMSGNAAKEISDMLASSVHKVESIVNETKSKVDVLISDGQEKVKAGTKVAEECGMVLSEIVSNVTSVSTMANEISNASEEQSKGIQEITKAMGQLDQVTQTNAATSEETASAAEELSSQATSLKNQVLTLVAVINGTKAPVEMKRHDKPSSPTMTKTPPAPKKAQESVKEKTAKVVPIKSAAKKPAPVVAEKPKAAPMAETKKAVGGNALPDYDHPGFEEV